MDGIPKKIFLDTNVVNFILEHSVHIHENVDMPIGIKSRVGRDIYALRNIWMIGGRMHWQIVISITTLDELSQTRDADKLQGLINWGQEIVDYQGGLEDLRGLELPHPVTTRKLLSILPDEQDRKLLTDALKARCDSFCTRDWKTLLKFREELKLIPLRIMAPHEWWENIRPYAQI